MKKVVLNVPDEMYSFFMELVQKLGLEKVDEDNIDFPEWKKELSWAGLKVQCQINTILGRR